MSKGRLTRTELGWLLTQEAQGAASRLRQGVQVMRTMPPAPMEAQITTPPSETPGSLDASLDALDDVMRMLENLHTKPTAPARRGRIDLAALLWEVAPEARVQMEPGGGTEVFGDESELRRMLHVLVGHGGGVGSQVTIRRDGADVRVAVTLGPDSSATAETERVWLSRMALRYGGRHELEGATEVLVLPADAEREEKEALRKELDEARKQGEAYARELAAVFQKGEELSTASSYPPPPMDPSTERLDSVVRLCAGIAAELRSVVAPLGRELAQLKGTPEQEELVAQAQKRMSRATDFISMLASVGELDAEEAQTDTNLVDVVRTAIEGLSGRSERAGVRVSMRAGMESTVRVRLSPRGAALLAREIIGLAVAATPRDGEVTVDVYTDPLGARLIVDDAGPPLPASARRGYIALEVDGGTYGRPSGVPLRLGAEIAAAHGAMLELSDAPAGGVRVMVTLPIR
jgi:signal transduction histidine kinase